MIMPGNRYTSYYSDLGHEREYRSWGMCHLRGVLEYLPGDI